MRGKLLQFDEALRHEISTSSLAMYPNETVVVEEIFLYLSQITASPTQLPSKPLTHVHVEAIIQILDRWPSSQRFPIIDLSRLIVGFCPDAYAAPGLREKFTDALFNASEWSAAWTSPLSKARGTNILLLLRTIANAFQEERGIDAGWLGKVVETIGQAPYTLLNRAQRVALATVLFNVSCEYLRSPLQVPVRDHVILLIAKILELETADSEAVYRALVGLGNAIHACMTNKASLQEAQKGDISQCLQSLPIRFPETRIRNVAVEIAALL